MNFKKIQTIAFFALLIGVAAIFFWMIYPYIFAIFWAAVFATLFHPVYRWVKKRLPSENLSAATTVVIVILVVIVPLAGVLGIVVQQAAGTYEKLRDPATITSIQTSIEEMLQQPLIQNYIGEIDVADRLQSASATITTTGLRWLQVGSRTTLMAIINILIMIYSLYYFFKDGERWLRRMMHLLPFGDDNEKILFDKFSSVGKATLKGTILLGGIQGTLGGLMFLIVGIPSAAFWGLIMIVLSIIPAVGSFIVWFPASIYLLATGQYWQTAVVVVGGLAIGILDNLLRPPLVGKDIQMHPMLILFSTIGGLGVFGISGVVVGPIIAAFFVSVLQMYETRYKKELDSQST